MYTELRAYLDYRQDDRPLSFWRTRDGKEVDFILGDDAAIEVKATGHPSERHLAGLDALSEEGTFRRRVLVCEAERPSATRGLEALPLANFVEELWSGRI